MFEQRLEGHRRGDRVRARRSNRCGQKGGRGHRSAARETRGARTQQTRKFRTFYPVLRQMVGWLVEQGVTQVAMEATGVFWKPVFHALGEPDTLEVVLVNARHVKNVPGRKTDVKDSEWLAHLLECGLLRGSFIPPKQIAAIRELTRYRKKTIQARTRELQRLVQGPRRRRDQDRFGGVQHHHPVGPGHDRGADRRSAGSPRAGRAGPRQDAHQDPGPDDGLRGSVRRPSRAAGPACTWTTSTTSRA